MATRFASHAYLKLGNKGIDIGNARRAVRTIGLASAQSLNRWQLLLMRLDPLLLSPSYRHHWHKFVRRDLPRSHNALHRRLRYLLC